MLIAALSGRRKRGLGIDGDLKRLMVVIGIASCISMLMAGFKAGVVLEAPSPLFSQVWYYSKACLYGFGFCPELTIVILFFVAKVDLKSQELESRESKVALPNTDSEDQVLETDSKTPAFSKNVSL